MATYLEPIVTDISAPSGFAENMILLANRNQGDAKRRRGTFRWPCVVIAFAVEVVTMVSDSRRKLLTRIKQSLFSL